MAEANVSLLTQAFNSNVAMGERATQADFEMLIEGMEQFAPLIRTAQLPEISRGEPLEDIGAHGLTYHQYGPIKRNGEITAGIVELRDGRVEDKLWELINSRTYVKVRLIRKGEGYEEKGFEMLHCILKADAGDLDTGGAGTAALRSIVITYSWCEKV